MFEYVKRLFRYLVRQDLISNGVLPTSADAVAAAAVALTSAGVAWTWGAYAEIVAAASLAVDTQITGITLEDFVGAPSQGEVQLAIGGAGSEVVEITVPAVTSYLPIVPPVHVNASTRIAARYRTSTGAADNVSVKLLTATGF